MSIEEDKYFTTWMKSALRRLWGKSTQKNAAMINGRKARGQYECEECKELVGRKEMHIDHIEPVVHTDRGFTGWDEYIGRLFCPPSGLRVLCIPCHTTVTNRQNARRRKVKKRNKSSEL